MKILFSAIHIIGFLLGIGCGLWVEGCQSRAQVEKPEVKIVLPERSLEVVDSATVVTRDGNTAYIYVVRVLGCYYLLNTRDSDRLVHLDQCPNHRKQ